MLWRDRFGKLGGRGGGGRVAIYENPGFPNPGFRNLWVFRIDLKVFRGQFRSADMPP